MNAAYPLYLIPLLPLLGATIALLFGKRLGKSPTVTGTEAPTAWLLNTDEAQKLFGKPSVPLATMIDWVADWVSRDMPSLGKDTHFSTRDGKY